MTLLRRYLLNVLIGVDQLANAIAGGDPDETISSRVGKRLRESKAGVLWARIVIACTSKKHCVDSIEDDEGKDALSR